MLNVTLPEPMQTFVEESIRSGRYGSETEVVCAGLKLLQQQEDERVRKLEELEAELLKGLDSPSRVMTDEDWERIKREARERLRQTQPK